VDSGSQGKTSPSAVRVQSDLAQRIVLSTVKIWAPATAERLRTRPAIDSDAAAGRCGTGSRTFCELLGARCGVSAGAKMLFSYLLNFNGVHLIYNEFYLFSW